MANEKTGTESHTDAPEQAASRMQPPRRLLDDEWRDIRSRRQTIRTRFGDGSDGRQIPERLENLPGAPDDGLALGKAELFGLAFSGGGIRSAAFNLGLMQALQRFGILKYVDYLSTVSGGGYIGSSLSAQMHGITAQPAQPMEFPYDRSEQIDGRVESAALRHLRNNGKYLAPAGGLDYVRMLAVLARGLGVNLLALLPLPVLAAFASALLAGGSLIDPEGAPSGFHWFDAFRATPYVAGALLVALLSSPVWRHWLWSERSGAADGANLHTRDNFERTLSWGWLVLGAVVALEAQPALIWGFHRLTDTARGMPSAELVASLSSAAGFVSSVAASNLAGSAMLRRNVLLAVGGLLGLLVPLSAYLYFADRLVYDAHLVVHWDAVSVGGKAFAKVQMIHPAYLASAVVIWAVLWWVLDVNDTAPHSFYRDRLSEAFLVERQGKRMHSLDDLKLSQLSQAGSLAPYHLINTAVNLQSGGDLDLRGRGSDTFLFSKYHIGSVSTGYCATRTMEAVVPKLNLGTAMAISGAAAAPNMGRATIRPLVMLMTLLNVRLGFWLPNPGKLRQQLQLEKDVAALGALPRAVARAKSRPGPMYLLREMLSLIGPSARLVNVSDGGHVENLAVYELLRRRCRYVICGDAEADPEMSFAGLATLMLAARVDLGVEIDLDLDNLALDASGNCHRHCAYGVIRYPAIAGYPAEEGHFVYVKLSVSGDEHPVVEEYRKRNPSFPHQSTGDQFFDEAQFEAYRALGDHALEDLMLGAFENAHAKADSTKGVSFSDVADWIARLQIALAPRHQSGVDVGADSLTGLLAEIEGLLQDEALARYQSQFTEGLDTASSTRDVPPEDRRKVYAAVERQLRLMETALFQLRLDLPSCREHPANSGWMNLFRRWSSAPLFRWGYALLAPTHSENFQSFCDTVLGLHLRVDWRESNLRELQSARLISADEAARFAKTEPAGRRNLFFAGSLAVGETESNEGRPVPVAYALVQVDGGIGRLHHSSLRPGYEGTYLYRQALICLRPYLSNYTATQARANDDIVSMQPVVFNAQDVGSDDKPWDLKFDTSHVPSQYRKRMTIPQSRA